MAEQLNIASQESSRPELFTHPTTNPHLRRLEDFMAKQVAEQGLTAEQASNLRVTRFHLPGPQPTKLEIKSSSLDSEHSRPGVYEFYVAPDNGQTDVYGRDAVFVRASFIGAENPSAPDENTLQASLAGVGRTNEELRQLALRAIDQSLLDQAELVDLEYRD